MIRPESGLAPALGAVLGLLGLAACADGCSRERPVAEPELANERMSLAEFDALLWPRSDVESRWQDIEEVELRALEQLVGTLLDAAPSGPMSLLQRRQLTTLAAFTGLELRPIEVLGGGEVELVWALLEPIDDRRGRGSYLIRVGRLGPAESGVETEILLEAPHGRHDRYTSEIALAMFIEREPGVRPPRALFVNSVHRYTQADGTRVERTPPEANRADAAHNVDHPLARATALALREHDLAVIQLHGFARSASAGDPDVIVSSGSSRPTVGCTALIERLRVALPDVRMDLFGVGVHRLGALTNVQGHAARERGRCFIHVELSKPVREQLHGDAAARHRFAAALLGGGAGEFGDACR